MKYSFIIVILFFTSMSNAQQDKNMIHAEKVWRLDFVNPGIEIETPTGTHSTFSANLGIGYGGSYPDLSYNENNGFAYLISPFLDIQEKLYYNFNRRKQKNKSIRNNSGNFLSARLLIRGNSIVDNFKRTSDLDFAIGPTWGIQRVYGKNFHLLFDVGPIYYFDGKGNGNVFPIMIQLNLGFDL